VEPADVEGLEADNELLVLPNKLLVASTNVRTSPTQFKLYFVCDICEIMHLISVHKSMKDYQ
jgi:hypothetical protein